MAQSKQQYKEVAQLKANFFRKTFFFSKSIPNVSKRIVNRKSRFRKNFPVENFSLGLYRFLTKEPHSENFRPIFLKKKFWIDSESFTTYSQPKKPISKKSPIENFFLDSTIFWPKSPKFQIFDLLAPVLPGLYAWGVPVVQAKRTFSAKIYTSNLPK